MMQLINHSIESIVKLTIINEQYVSLSITYLNLTISIKDKTNMHKIMCLKEQEKEKLYFVLCISSITLMNSVGD